jgi:hypothetical protein
MQGGSKTYLAPLLEDNLCRPQGLYKVKADFVYVHPLLALRPLSLSLDDRASLVLSCLLLQLLTTLLFLLALALRWGD